MQQALAEELVAMICDTMDVTLDAANAGIDTPLFAGGFDLDSFAVVELITQLEERHNFEFDDGDFLEEHFATPRSLASLLETYLATS
ncbi:acyl carrier protein [Mangrovimicrobium sediminis]|uniref:Acyl carrier protein n=1 Tax=Mangrovimicrobium sediminis TaxID=2562682 RepID=A0A4Z0M3W0_9GAMM|nr:phosphopantetheine-binding protein [Haliea sp. SAOS-164]TGD74144.1 acyl carrier protein [Haliea sp. SAOS-164]